MPAALLQTLAEIGGITVSDAVRGAVRGKVLASFVDQGEQDVKNIPDPIGDDRDDPLAAFLRAAVSSRSAQALSI